MSIRPTLVALLLLVPLLALPLAAAQDDAGTGADAPDRREDAIDVPVMVLAGELDAASGDRWDWYRVIVPAGMGLQVTLQQTTTRSFNYQATTDAGFQVSQGCSCVADGPFREVIAPYSGEALRIGVWDGFAGPQPVVGYRVELELTALPDIAVTSIEVRETGLATPFHREVVATVVSEGAMPAEGVSAWAYVQHPDSSGQRALGQVNVGTMLPGASAEVRFLWDQTGEIGVADVRVVALPRYDGDRADNSLTVSADTLVPGSPVSEDVDHALVGVPGVGPFQRGSAVLTERNPFWTSVRIMNDGIPYLDAEYRESSWPYSGYDRHVRLFFSALVGIYLDVEQEDEDVQADATICVLGLACAAAPV